MKVDENLYQKYTKREQTPSVSENAVQEDLRKLRRMQVFMCAALAMTLLIAAANIRICHHDEVVSKQRFKCIKKHGAR